MEPTAKTKIAVVGAGAIGSTFALQLARAGHDVTVVARRNRLAQLQESAGIETTTGMFVATGVSAKLDPAVPWDLVIVSVRAQHVDAVLPEIAGSAAKKVMFMFNTFEPLDRLRAAVGATPSTFGFPSILARVDERGRLQSSIQAKGLLTTVTDAATADMFTSAGIPSVVETDMQSWLRSHAAAVVPFMLAVTAAHERHAGISWAEAARLAAAMIEGFQLVRRLGSAVIPAPVWFVSQLPPPAIAALLWLATRAPALRESGAAGAGEASALIDAMLSTSSDDLPALRRVRPAAAHADSAQL
jgi:2-dehydropantoate 2-reductase